MPEYHMKNATGLMNKYKHDAEQKLVRTMGHGESKGEESCLLRR